MKVTIQDGRTLVGKFLAFDKHMNVVLADAEEFRRVGVKAAKKSEEKEEKRSLGLIVLRGENIISMTAIGPPPAEERMPKPGSQGGPGVAKPAGRGLPAPAMTSAPALQAPVKGLGGPAPQFMQPAGGAPPGAPPGMPGASVLEAQCVDVVDVS
eukprot:TRINITY_DN1295_c0_g2_i2.p1 TRINITY_DN1295_c0_g2~~TRINITY_DN1295_c0_g2_i2.p1  ORF type:complete len:176 (-),score=50.68 TRINITY_DN1295_c0_g2_i2:360-821(-)